MFNVSFFLTEDHTDDVQSAVNEVKKLLNDNDISTNTLDLMYKVISGNLAEGDIRYLMNQIIVGSRDQLRQVMNSIDILLMLESDSINNAKVSNHLVDLISSLKYFEAGRSSSVIYQLVYVIDHPLLTGEAYRHIIIEAFRENLDKLDLSLNKSDRELIESIYSLSILIKIYYDSLTRSEISISNKFATIIKELSQSKLKEVRYMWVSD